ncbi:hypothetical protein ACEOVB_29470 [Pseudomonas aeruginosa]
MQYAIIRLPSKSGVEVERLVDANELQTLELFKEEFQELPFKEEGDFFVCYGCYCPQPGIEAEEALGDLLEARDHWLGHVNRDKGHGIAFHDVEAYAAFKLGKRAIRIPFAAVIQAEPEVIEAIGGKGVQAVTAFLRYQQDMGALDNIFNRKGLMAIKGIERRQRDAEVTLQNWKEFADAERAKRVASKIV